MEYPRNCRKRADVCGALIRGEPPRFCENETRGTAVYAVHVRREQTAIHDVISRERASITRRSVAPCQNISTNFFFEHPENEISPIPSQFRPCKFCIYLSLSPLGRLPTTTDIPVCDISPIIVYRENLIDFSKINASKRYCFKDHCIYGNDFRMEKEKRKKIKM